MIQKTQAFKSSDGDIYANIEDAQKAELEVLLKPQLPTELTDYQIGYITNALVELSPKVIDILTTTATSIPAARAINGNKRPRKKKHIAEQFPLTGVEPTTANP